MAQSSEQKHGALSSNRTDNIPASGGNVSTRRQRSFQHVHTRHTHRSCPAAFAVRTVICSRQWTRYRPEQKPPAGCGATSHRGHGSASPRHAHTCSIHASLSPTPALILQLFYSAIFALLFIIVHKNLVCLNQAAFKPFTFIFHVGSNRVTPALRERRFTLFSETFFSGANRRRARETHLPCRASGAGCAEPGSPRSPPTPRCLS